MRTPPINCVCACQALTTPPVNLQTPRSLYRYPRGGLLQNDLCITKGRWRPHSNHHFLSAISMINQPTSARSPHAKSETAFFSATAGWFGQNEHGFRARHATLTQLRGWAGMTPSTGAIFIGCGRHSAQLRSSSRGAVACTQPAPSAPSLFRSTHTPPILTLQVNDGHGRPTHKPTIGHASFGLHFWTGPERPSELSWRGAAQQMIN